MEPFTPDPRLSELIGYNFSPLMNLPPEIQGYKLLNHTKGESNTIDQWTIGRYNEVRENMYNTSLFSGIRNIHMGIDLGAPIDTPVMSFAKGTIHSFGYNEAAGDYGYVVILQYKLGNIDLWALYGHLGSSTIDNNRLQVGQTMEAGDVVGWIGSTEENGGWKPHLHFQLSLKQPSTHDMPGVVSADDRAQAILDYPHPFHVTGQLY